MTILSLKRGTAAAQEVITLVAGNKPAVIFIRACMVGSLLVMVLISAHPTGLTSLARLVMRCMSSSRSNGMVVAAGAALYAAKRPMRCCLLPGLLSWAIIWISSLVQWRTPYLDKASVISASQELTRDIHGPELPA
jgi:hypothetical protein